MGFGLFINVPIAIVAALIIAAFVPTSRDGHEAPFDPVGSPLSIPGLASLVLLPIRAGPVAVTSGRAQPAVRAHDHRRFAKAGVEKHDREVDVDLLSQRMTDAAAGLSDDTVGATP